MIIRKRRIICIGRTSQYACTKLVVHKLSKYNYVIDLQVCNQLYV